MELEGTDRQSNETTISLYLSFIGNQNESLEFDRFSNVQPGAKYVRTTYMVVARHR